MKALIEGQVDVVGVWADAPESKKGQWTLKPFSEFKPGFRVLEISPPIPNDAFAVREAFYKSNPMIVFKVMEALIGMSDDKSTLLKEIFDVDRMATATSRHYDSVREAAALMSEKR